MNMNHQFFEWELNADVSGETAAYGDGDRLIDLVVTPLERGGVEFDVVDGVEIAWRGYSDTLDMAKIEALAIAKRMFFRTI